LSAYGQVQTYYFARLTPNWNYFNKYSVSTPVFWQNGSRVYNNSAGAADYEQIGLGLNVSRSLTEKLSAGFSYQFVQETSNQSGLAYTANIVDLNFTYHF
jgi:outer membrane protein assembly factor BamA